MKVALVGGNGNFGLKRLRSILPSGDQVVALCDLRHDRALSLLPTGSVRLTTDYRDLVADDADVVVVSTPDFAKGEIVEFFLRAGKHVLVEKPFILRTEEVRRLFGLARRHGVCLYTGYNLRFFPSLAKVLSLAGDGYFGSVHHLRMYYGHGGVQSKLKVPEHWQMDPGVTWGGSLVDMGVHLLSLAARFAAMIDDGRFEVQNVFSPQVEDHCVGVLRCGRCLVELTSSWTTWRSRFAIELYGSEGFAESEGLVKYVKYGQPGERLRWGKRNPQGGVPEVQEILFTLPQHSGTGALEVDPFSAEVEYLDHEWAWFGRSIQAGTFSLEEEETLNLFIADAIERFYPPFSRNR